MENLIADSSTDVDVFDALHSDAGHEADHSPFYTYVFMAWYLVKHRGNFTFTLPYNAVPRLRICGAIPSVACGA
jgi:hypothetical protein